jgi:hypothetical protein
MSYFVRENCFWRSIFLGLRVVASTALVGLSACSVVGPASIDQGRMRYSDIIHDTSTQQTLLNLVRVHNNESPFFMDVTEVDAASTIGASIVGGPSGLGASPNFKTSTAGTLSGAVGFITGGAQYQEQPTVRYQPLLGQPLVAQIQTPLTAEDLAKLLNAHWPLSNILTLGTTRLTAGYSQHFAALDAMVDLDHYGAIVFDATPTPDKEKMTAKIIDLDHKDIRLIASNENKEKKKEDLTIYRSDKNKNGYSYSDANYLLCDELNNEFRYIPSNYKDIDFHNYALNFDKKPDLKKTELARKNIETLWERLREIYDNKDKNKENEITLGTNARDGKPPVLVTRSALAIMQASAQESPDETAYFEFIKDDNAIEMINRAVEIYSRYKIDYEKNNKKETVDCRENFYMESWLKIPPDEKNIDGYPTTLNPDRSTYAPSDFNAEHELAKKRKFMLIAESDTPPPADVYVSVQHRGKWYFILKDDEVSQRTLMLIAQFNTILATPPQSGLLTPSISVGAR